MEISLVLLLNKMIDSLFMYSTDRVFFQKSSRAGGEWIRVERIKFWNPTASSPVPVDSPRSRDESHLKFF